MKLEDLLLLAKKGDGRAFEQIVLQTERAVYNLALSIVKKKEDAEDVTQETYLRLWRAASELKLESSLKLYILRTARNLALDLIRKNSKRDEIDTVILDADGEFVGYFVEVLEMKEAYEADFDYEAEFFEGQQIFIDGYETWQSNLADMPVFEENLFEPGEVIEAEVIYIDIYPAEPAENYHCFRIFSLL